LIAFVDEGKRKESSAFSTIRQLLLPDTPPQRQG
jgi:hypothetical protein